MKSHTGVIMTFGNNIIICDSTKQKVNAKSSTESEMVAAYNTSLKMLCTKHFMEAQGHNVNANIVDQNNKNAMKSETNENAS
jgi:hypothetical protein